MLKRYIIILLKSSGKSRHLSRSPRRGRAVAQSLACLVLLAAVVGTALRWDVPSAAGLRQDAVDRAVRKDFTALKTKPGVKVRIQVVRPATDSSNGSYAALGFRASF